MPDWLTYALSAWVLCEVLALAGMKGARRYLGAAAVGSVLPDLVKPFFLLRTLSGPDLIAFSIPFATPVGVVLVAGLVSTFFGRRDSRRVLAFLVGGAALHLAWDMTLHPYGGGTLALFPLSFNQYSLGLIWPDSIIPLIIAGIAACAVYGVRVLTSRDLPRRGGI